MHRRSNNHLYRQRLRFGGIDIIVNNAGLSISKTMESACGSDWDLLYDVLVKGQFLVTQKALAMLRKQGLGGDVLNIVSKNALVSGPNNAGYGSAKAAQLHLSRSAMPPNWVQIRSG